MRVKLKQTIEEPDGERRMRFHKGTYANFGKEHALKLIDEKLAEAAPGPELALTPAEGPDVVSIDFTYTGTLALIVGGTAHATIPTSPLSVPRSSSPVTVRFEAMLNDATVEHTIIVPAFVPAPAAEPAAKPSTRKRSE